LRLFEVNKRGELAFGVEAVVGATLYIYTLKREIE
jgi:hypothetical protein